MAEQITTEEQLEQLNKLLVNYDITMGLGTPMVASNAIEKYLKATQADLKSMSQQECCEANVLFNQAATFIQRELNKQSAILEWAEDKLKRLIAGEIENAGSKYMPYDYRKELVVAQNDVAVKLSKVITEAKLRVKSMEFIPTQLRNHAASFHSLSIFKGARQ